MMTALEREIHEQPVSLARLLADAQPEVAAIAAAVRAFEPRFVVTAARGSSDNAARYATYLFGAHNHLVVSLGAPSLVTRYAAPPSFAGALVLGVSQSGESPDVVALAAEARRQGALTVALTNEVASPLAHTCAYVLGLRAGPERAVVATKTYAAELLALAMLSTAIAGDGARAREIERIPDAVEETLALCPIDHVRARVHAYVRGQVAEATSAAGATSPATALPPVRADQLIVVGRGFNLASAFEVALKIKEATYALAEPYAAPDLLHGPMAMIDAGFPVLAIAPSGATAEDMRHAIAAVAARGAHVIAISDDRALLAAPHVRAALPLAPGVPEWLSPITAVVPGQCWALALAEARGLDPDHPRGLAKITRTF